jgi:hypothetical protein
MRSPAVLGFLAVLAIGAVGLVVAGFATGSALVYTPGVTPFSPVVTLQPGQRACMRPISTPDGATFERVRVFAGRDGIPGPPLEASVATVKGGDELGRGRLAGGYRGAGKPAPVAIPVGRVHPTEPIEVCVRDAGSAPVALWGAPTIASKSDTVLGGGPPLGSDISVRLERAHERSLIAGLPDEAERASVFKAGVLSPPVWLVFALVVLLGVPALLVLALRRADG